MMATLYEIEDKFKLIQSLIEDGADEEVFSQALEQIHVELSEKLEGYAMVIKNIESDVEGYKTEEKRLSTRRKSMENKVKRMKENMQQAMIAANERKIQGEKFTFTVQKNPPSLKVIDARWIPARFFTQPEPVLDKKSLLNEIKDGKEVKGAEIKQGESIRIR